MYLHIVVLQVMDYCYTDVGNVIYTGAEPDNMADGGLPTNF
jgi:hypothetical protein